MPVATKVNSVKSNLTITRSKTTLIPKSIKKVMLKNQAKLAVEGHHSSDLLRLLESSCDCV
jgi:hypothetical protein